MPKQDHIASRDLSHTASGARADGGESDFSHAEARRYFRAFCREIGAVATCDVSLSSELRGEHFAALTSYLRPRGWKTNAPQLTFFGNTYRELLAATREGWAEHSNLHAANTIREMALAIIAITADQGECTDAALRAKFDAADVTRFGERACEQATEMASNGPFSIVKLSGANDVEAA